VRWLSGGVFAGFSILTLDSTAEFYRSLQLGHIKTDLPVPLSAFFFPLLVLDFVRVFWWRPVESLLPPPAQVFFRGIFVTAAFLSLTLLHVVTAGHIDNRRPADAAVILGAKIYEDGTLSRALLERLETGIELYEQGLVSYLIMTGAPDPNGQ